MKLTKMTVLGLVALTGLALNSTVALAVDTSNASTPTDIELTTGGDGGGTDPIIPIDPPEPPTTGPLRIDAVSPFNFGKIELGKAESKDVVVPAGKTVGVQVSDLTGEGNGWKLSAKIGDIKGINKPTNILKATISIPEGKVTTSADGDLTKPAVAQAIVLNGMDQTVMSAKKDNGLGIWANTFVVPVEGKDPKTVSITVPTNAYVDKYKGDITWTLTNAL